MSTSFYVLCLGFVFGIVLAVVVPTVTPAQEHRIVLRGTLYTQGSPDDCHFLLDPVADGETLNLEALQQGFVCDWLKGYNGKALEITLGNIQ